MSERGVKITIKISFANELWHALVREARRKDTIVTAIIMDYLIDYFNTRDDILDVIHHYKFRLSLDVPSSFHQIKLTTDILSTLNETSYRYKEARDVIVCGICKLYLLGREGKDQ